MKTIHKQGRSHASLLGVVFSSFLFFQCNPYPSSINVRAIFEHTYGSSLTMQVFVEGENGISLNGSRVIVRAPSGMSLLLRYNGTRACYEGTIQSPEGGTYMVSVKTTAYKDEFNLEIPCNILTQTPSIIDIQDSQGKSYIKGEKPNHTLPLTISWNPVAGATVYILRVYQQANLIYVQTLTDSIALVPANTLSGGTYAFSIEAQSISGDPLLLQEEYYAYSSSSGSSVVCTIE